MEDDIKHFIVHLKFIRDDGTHGMDTSSKKLCVTFTRDRMSQDSKFHFDFLTNINDTECMDCLSVKIPDWLHNYKIYPRESNEEYRVIK